MVLRDLTLWNLLTSHQCEKTFHHGFDSISH